MFLEKVMCSPKVEQPLAPCQCSCVAPGPAPSLSLCSLGLCRALGAWAWAPWALLACRLQGPPATRTPMAMRERSVRKRVYPAYGAYGIRGAPRAPRASGLASMFAVSSLTMELLRGRRRAGLAFSVTLHAVLRVVLSR